MTFWVAGAAIGGALITSAASGDANDAQAQSSRESNQVNKEISDSQIALQREQFNRSLELQEPFRQSGLNAQNRLNFLLGLSQTGRGATDPQITTIRNRLLPQFTEYRNTPGLSGAELDAAVEAEVAKWAAAGFNATEFDRNNIRQAKSTGGSSEITRDVELDAAVQAELAKQQGATGGQPGAQGGEFGSLMRDFGMADYEADPGLAFRREEGEKALTRAAGASGQLGSGRYLKDAMRFNSGLASQEYSNAHNRFQTNRANKLNPLQSLAGVGQTAANTIGQAGQNFASGAGNALGNYGQATSANILGVGNARASGYLTQGNALQNALNSGVSAWRNRPTGTAGGGGWGASSGWGAGINPNSGEYMGSLEF
jgi:hypothetical protein